MRNQRVKFGSTTLQLLDYNWQNGEYTVLESTFFRNGHVIANSKTSGDMTLIILS
ncbi:hypothetical protein [Desertivirga xinjiangensis]|uniref:hypothetical protein n=1 Tax=Desertivirga xinjiangensis TaxID=539206 RepID=UPI002108EA32|nr:hypothetical protein [Pedobacter xinjiangensis]